MKIRNGFVSNSSSSSFVVDKSKISQMQYYYAMYPEKYAPLIARYRWDKDKELRDEWDDSYDRYYENLIDNRLGWISAISGWKVKNEDNQINFSTSMDTFDYAEYLLWAGIPSEAIVEKYRD